MNKRMLDDLLRRLGHTQENVGETQSESSVAMQLEISDLKAKILRLTEQYTEHDAKVNFFSGMSEQVTYMEQQIHRWRHRLPDLSDDDSREPVVSAVEVQEELDKFKDVIVKKVREVNNAPFSLEREVRLLERARNDSWEVISQRLSILVDGSVSALSERLTDLEHTVQSRMTTPVTDTSATHVFRDYGKPFPFTSSKKRASCSFPSRVFLAFPQPTSSFSHKSSIFLD